MDFYLRDPTTSNCIPQRDGRVCETTGIEDHRVSSITHRTMERVDEYPLAIGLQKGEVNSTGLRTLAQSLVHLFKGHSSIALRLPSTQEVEVRTVENQDLQEEPPSGRLTGWPLA